MFKFIIAILLISLFYLYRESRFTYVAKVHYPPQPIQTKNSNANNFYQVGPYEYTPDLSFIDIMTRKKIVNYVFVLDNQHKFEIALIDLGYASVVNANYFSGVRSYSFEDFLSLFSLPQDFRPQFALKRSCFYIKKTNYQNSAVTELQVNIKQADNQIYFKFTYHQDQKSCVTFVRQGVISYKCYGGWAQGKAYISVKQKYDTWFNRTYQVSRSDSTVGFDGFRASGWNWRWVWGMASGFKQQSQRRFSINFGSINGLSQDMIYVDQRVVPVPDLRYEFNENSTNGDIITFRSQQPQLQLNFTVTVRQHKYKDMLLMKNDMVKLQGYWTGWWKDQQSGKLEKIEGYPGLLQAADSIF